MEQNASGAQDFIRGVLKGIAGVVYGFAYVGDIVDRQFKHLPYAITIGLPLTHQLLTILKLAQRRYIMMNILILGLWKELSWRVINITKCMNALTLLA